MALFTAGMIVFVTWSDQAIEPLPAEEPLPEPEPPVRPSRRGPKDRQNQRKKPTHQRENPIPVPIVPAPVVCPVPSPYQRPGDCRADPPPGLRVALFLAETRKIKMTDNAVLSLLKNTPTAWPLILMYPEGPVKEWLKTLSWTKLKDQQNR